MADDYRNTYNGAGALGAVAPGGSSTGNIEAASDTDIFQVSLVAGRTYVFNLTGQPGGGGTLPDSYLVLQDATGGYLTSNFDGPGTTDSVITYTSTRTGIFYLSAASQATGGTGTYTVAVSSGFVDDYRDVYNDTNEALGSLALGGTRTGTLENEGDQDVFAVSLVAGRTYTFDMKGFATSGGTLPDPYLTLQDATGGYLTSSFDSNGTPDSQIIYTATRTGVFYLLADSQTTSGTGTYTLAANTGFVDDYRDVYNDTNEALGALATNGSVTGNVEIDGDDDVFAIDLIAGRTYTFDLKGQPGGGGTLADAYLVLQDATGGYVSSSFDGPGTTDSQIVYTATATARYHLVASSQQTVGTGTYTLSSDDGFNDDYRDTWNDTTEALGALTPGGTNTGTIELDGDDDVFAITLTAGRVYTFSVRGASSSGGTLADPYLVLQNATGGYLTSDFDSGDGTDARASYTVTQTGTYYLVASGQQPTGTGTYTVTASAGTAVPDDYGDTIGDTAPIPGNLAINGTRNGTIEIAGDRDVFKITLKAGQTYTFDLTGTGAGELVDPQVRIMNAAGTTLRSNDNFNGYDSRVVFTPTAAGTYYLEARSHTGPGAGTYTISARAGFDDYADTRTDTTSPLGQLAPNAARLGTLETNGDRDIFAIQLVAGRSYTFDLTGSAVAGAELVDPLLRLQNGAGTVLVTNDDFNGPDSRIVFNATTTGTYYLEARSHGNTGIGTYEIRARVNFDDWADSLTDTASPMGAVVINGSSYGNIETSGDRDLFAVQLVAGRSYTFDLAGSTITGAELADGFLRLLNSSGSVLRSNGDYNSDDSRIVFTPGASGTYYLDVRSELAGGTGSYTIGARQGFDDHADSIWDPTSPLGILASNSSRLGTIETPGDSDVWRVSLVAGRRYAIDLKVIAPASGGISDPDLQLTNANGTILAYDNDSGTDLNARIVFTAEDTGFYYLTARGVGSRYGTYEIGIRNVGTTAARAADADLTAPAHDMFAPHGIDLAAWHSPPVAWDHHTPVFLGHVDFL